MRQIPARALTHGGKFHADDVFSAALLRILNPQVEILRAFEVPVPFDGLVFDLGRGEFDHHQPDAAVRPNGVPYAAFGLLWRAFGAELIGEENAAKFDERFVQPLDLDDNTGCGAPLADMIGAFNPSWDSEESADGAYWEAVGIAQRILERQFETNRSAERAKCLVRASLSKMRDGIAVLDVYAPWKSEAVNSEAVFVIYPSQRGGFSAQAVPAADKSGELKCRFPQAWAGLDAPALQALTGLPSLRFCHNNGFLIAADTLEDAAAACALAREAAK